MYYLLLKEAAWKVLVPCDAFRNSEITFEGDSTVNLFSSMDLSAKDEAIRARIINALDRLAHRGTQAFTSGKSHIVDTVERIFSVDVGPYRILYCFEGDKIVVCCHLYRKKSQRVPREATRAAAKVRADYLSSVRSGRQKILKPV